MPKKTPPLRRYSCRSRPRLWRWPASAAGWSGCVMRNFRVDALHPSPWSYRTLVKNRASFPIISERLTRFTIPCRECSWRLRLVAISCCRFFKQGAPGNLLHAAVRAGGVYFADWRAISARASSMSECTCRTDRSRFRRAPAIGSIDGDSAACSVRHVRPERGEWRAALTRRDDIDPLGIKGHEATTPSSRGMLSVRHTPWRTS
jgi:hypothetical protein